MEQTLSCIWIIILSLSLTYWTLFSKDENDFMEILFKMLTLKAFLVTTAYVSLLTVLYTFLKLYIYGAFFV